MPPGLSEAPGAGTTWARVSEDEGVPEAWASAKCMEVWKKVIASDLHVNTASSASGGGVVHHGPVVTFVVAFVHGDHGVAKCGECVVGVHSLAHWA